MNSKNSIILPFFAALPPAGGIILINEKDKAVCAACGHKLKKKPKLQASEKIANKEITTIINEKEETTDPIVEIKCIKCDNRKAYFWTRQTRGSDESETKFYKCTKCAHTWREYR